MCTCAYGCPSSPVTKNHLYSTSWELKYRTGFYLGAGLHPNQHSQVFNSAFYNSCADWMNSVNTYSYTYGGYSVDWIGDIGTVVCKSGMHPLGRAFDLTRIEFAFPYGPRWVDMKLSWKDAVPLEDRRRYLATAAATRRYFSTVLTAWYDSDHHDHIHVDNGVTLAPLRTNYPSDVTLIQAACKYLNNAAITINGSWNSATQSAYPALLTKLGCQCLSPTSDVWHMWILLEMIARTGFANATAGAYKHTC